MPLIKTTHYSQKCFLMVFFTLIVWKNFDLLSLLLKGKEGQKQRERERMFSVFLCVPLTDLTPESWGSLFLRLPWAPRVGDMFVELVCAPSGA